MVIRKLEHGWMVAVDDDGRELIRFKMPEGGFTMKDVDRFREHLLKLVREREHGPS